VNYFFLAQDGARNVEKRRVAWSRRKWREYIEVVVAEIGRGGRVLVHQAQVRAKCWAAVDIVTMSLQFTQTVQCFSPSWASQELCSNISSTRWYVGRFLASRFVSKADNLFSPAVPAARTSLSHVRTVPSTTFACVDSMISNFRRVFECRVLFLSYSPGVCSLNTNVSEHSVYSIFIGE
jgi:hypothetical protein